jgi:geranylgeranyl pyrophosphate synthase
MPYDDDTVEEVIGLVRAGGYIDRSLHNASERLRTADAALENLPAGEPRQILEKLGGFLVERVEAVRL